MALQSEAIENRLEGLVEDDRRVMFGSHLRAIQRDCKPPSAVEVRGAKPVEKSSKDHAVDGLIVLIEELSRRIDGLEKKDRALAGEIRQRAKSDQRRFSLITVAGGGGVVIFLACWALKLL